MASLFREDAEILIALEPVAGRALDDHLRHSPTWYPHTYVPWSQGRDYEGVYEGKPWEPAQCRLSAPARDALVHNLLAEENLPSYHRVIARMFGMDGAWGTWVNRWTVEEGRHGMAIRDYLLVTRAVDPVVLEEDRAAHVQHGWDTDYRDDVVASLVYVAIQELGTRVSYHNTRRLCGEPGCEALLQRISQDENLHMLFYRTVLQAAMELCPDRVLQAVARVMADGRGPGHAAPGHTRLLNSMVQSGIFTPVTYHEEVLQPFTRAMRVFEAGDLGPAGEQAREQIAGMLEHHADRARRFGELSERLRLAVK
ncbi:acyl-ACP desaturase [Streptomyces sp. NPDC051567]|uniref:acyl-ACP desaturase n=1 Tax=Streptomyces sp. NPDC051567 TaxID=3365660 RepID=UPI0037A5DC52